MFFLYFTRSGWCLDQQWHHTTSYHHHCCHCHFTTPQICQRQQRQRYYQCQPQQQRPATLMATMQPAAEVVVVFHWQWCSRLRNWSPDDKHDGVDNASEGRGEEQPISAAVKKQLKRNTYLEQFWTQSSSFTKVGVRVLYAVLFDVTNLNTVADSNHPSQLHISMPNENPHLEWINIYGSPRANKKSYSFHWEKALKSSLPGWSPNEAHAGCAGAHSGWCTGKGYGIEVV